MRAMGLLLLVVTSAGVGRTQVVAGGASDKAGAEAEVQVSVLDFRSKGPVQGVGAAPLMVIPFQCTEDGAVFLHLTDGKYPVTENLYSLLEGKSQRFDPKMITGLEDVQVLDYFPTRSMVAFLVQAAKAGTSSEGKATRDRGSHHTYVAEFDRQGNYQKSVQLAMEYPLFRLAVLPSGEFLVTGYDSATDAEQLLLLDDAGQLVRVIDQPLSAAERATRRGAGSYKRMYEGAQSAGRTRFTGYKDSVLAWRAETNDPVLVIAAGGATREVSLGIPQGLIVADMLPSDDQWVIHAHSASDSDAGPHDLLKYRHYEVSPLDGSLLREIRAANPEIGSIACKSNGKYFSFSRDKEKKVVEFVADDH